MLMETLEGENRPRTRGGEARTIGFWREDRPGEGKGECPKIFLSIVGGGEEGGGKWKCAIAKDYGGEGNS